MIRRLLILATVVGLVIVGCDVWGSTAPERPVAQIGDADAFSCDTRFPPPDAPARPSPGTVPPDFEVVAAITCTDYIGDETVGDLTTGYDERRWEGDFTQVLRWLNKPSERDSWFTYGCDASYSLPMVEEMWLLDSYGRAVQPGYPVDDCGVQNVAGLYEIYALENVSTAEFRLTAEERFDRQRVTSCAPIYRPSAPGELPMGAATIGTTFCLFTFVAEGPRFDGTTEAEVLVASLLPAPECGVAASRVAATQYVEAGLAEHRQLLVELDGCRRVLADGYASMAATDELLSAFS